MIEYKCDNCNKICIKEEIRTIVIHPRDRKIWIKFPVKNPDRKKFGTRLLCLKCLKISLGYDEDEHEIKENKNE